ncbi:MAG: transcription antitermination factor NusB [Microbacteriaceae bacterium]
MTVQPARQIAYDVIAAVRESDAYANLLLPTRISRARLSTADAALATELTYGTLRMLGYYDRVIALAARRSVQEIDQPILDVLRLGAHQLLSMRVAPHAAVNESVELARSVGSRSATGFCNGVLRTITRSSPQQWLQRVKAATVGTVATAAAADELLAAEYSHPLWIVRAMKQALAAEGRQTELVDLLTADNVPPRVNMAALPGVAIRPADAMANDYSPVGFVLEHGDPHDLMAGSDGALRVQDEGSQLVALTLSRARPIEPGERWLDLCAGPGGKAALLAAEARAAGATLVANEVIPARSRLVARALAPLGRLPGPAPELWIRDGRTIGDTNPGQFDRILLDAPCTGLGALRRRPEARWRKSPQDVAELVTLQAELLDSALRALKPGGIMVYATCSPHPGETRVAVAGALKRATADVTACDTHAVLQAISAHPLDLAGDPAQAQLWPHRHGTDAMFITLLGRRQ